VLDFLEEAGNSSWCRQVSRSSSVAGSGHQSEHDLVTSPFERIVPCCLGLEKADYFSWVVVLPGGMRVLSQIFIQGHFGYDLRLCRVKLCVILRSLS
jgi:hypothetical protein